MDSVNIETQATKQQRGPERRCKWCGNPLVKDIVVFCSIVCRNRGNAFKKRKPMTLERLFARCKRDDNGCLVYQGPLNHNGHGVAGNGQLAHREAWRLANGPIPPVICVCHRCDNPACLEPKHLWLGTNSDNQRDKVCKGRQAHVGRRFTDSDIARMQSLHSSGATARSIARRFSSSEHYIHKILAGRARKPRTRNT